MEIRTGHNNDSEHEEVEMEMKNETKTCMNVYGVIE